MKKFIFSILIAFMAVLSINAQTQSNYCGSSKFFDNMSVGVVGGIETNLHDWNSPNGAIAGVVINKEITPIIGMTVEANTNINGLRNWNAGMSHIHCGRTIDALAVYLNGRINLMNAFLGYNGSPRTFEVETNTGIGYGRSWHNGGNDAILTKFGLNFNYNVTDSWCIQLRPSVAYNINGGNGFNVNNAVGQVTAGIIYRFKTSNGTYSFNKAKLYNQSEIDELNSKINQLQDDLTSAKEAMNTIETIDTVFITKPTIDGNIVSFRLNSSIVDETQMANIDKVAKLLYNNENIHVILKGYADKNTGNPSYNKNLSERRAEAVKNILVDIYGINSERIDIIGVGDTEQLYEDNNWNRVVLFMENK